jgi:hypothetical protein
MAFVNPFRLPGHWLRGNTHTHTTRSDGELTPEARCAQYRERGYDFLVLTDHDLVAGDAESFGAEDFLVVPGAELHPSNPNGGDIYHIVCINIREQIDARNLSVREVLEAVRAQGGLAVMTHPYFSGHLLGDYEPVPGMYFAMEVFNGIVERVNRTGSAELLWDAHLDRMGCVFGIAADDAHAAEIDTGRAWLMVRAGDLSIESLVEALRAGAFYATQGPVIENLEVEAGAGGRARFRVTSSPAAEVRFKGRTSTGTVVCAPEGGAITEAEYICTGAEKYIRVVVVDREGKRAWSNPVFLADLAT